MTVNINGESNTVTFQQVTMGDVILCIGDENMLYPMSDIINASEEIAKSTNYPSIRIATLPTINSNTPQNIYPSNSNIEWQQANPSTLPSFSAVCYLSAQKLLDLYQSKGYGKNRPMALIQVAVSKASLNCWMSSEAIKQANTQCTNDKVPAPTLSTSVCNDSTLYNGMLNPLIQQTYRSGIFYGASNAEIVPVIMDVNLQ